jgi:hypothetical protein
MRQPATVAAFTRASLATPRGEEMTSSFFQRKFN